jgi:hypothetical protein
VDTSPWRDAMTNRRLLPARHEPTDVGPRLIWIGGGLLLAMTVLMALIVLWLFPRATTDTTLELPLPRYPNPSLQPDPQADMKRFYEDEMRRLNSAGWIDKANNIAHIPISDAMREVAREGVPGWPSTSETLPVVQKEAPPSPASSEKSNEAARSTHPSYHATSRACGVEGGSQRDCIRTKAGRDHPPPPNVSRRERRRRAIDRFR